MSDPLSLFFLLALGLVMIAVVRGVTRHNAVAELRQTGRAVTATVTRIQQRTATTHAGSPPQQIPHASTDYYIEATWADPRTGVGRDFRSDCVDWWTSRKYQPGAPITVLLDPNDPSRYYVDTES
jgi:hypothetical protein